MTIEQFKDLSLDEQESMIDRIIKQRTVLQDRYFWIMEHKFRYIGVDGWNAYTMPTNTNALKEFYALKGMENFLFDLSHKLQKILDDEYEFLLEADILSIAHYKEMQHEADFLSKIEYDEL